MDGAHALGMVPLDLARLGAAYYTANAHKWLCAPKGAAFLHVRRDRQKGLHPVSISHGYAGGEARFKDEFDWTGTVDPTAALCIPDCIAYLGGLLPGGWPELMATNRALALKARAAICETLGVPAPAPESMLGVDGVGAAARSGADHPRPDASTARSSRTGCARAASSRGSTTGRPAAGSSCASRRSSTTPKSSSSGSRAFSPRRCVRAEAGKIDAQLGTFDTAMVVVSLVVGIGIFRTPAIVARETGTPGLFLLAWGIGGLVSLVGALMFAEIGSRHPRAGGYYRVVADCYHPALAFRLNWAQTLMQGAGAAGVAFIGAEYLVGLLLPPEQRGGNSVLLVALVLMLVLLVLNGLGIRVGAGTQNVLSMLKIVMIVGLAVAALALAPKARRSGSVASRRRCPRASPPR